MIINLNNNIVKNKWIKTNLNLRIIKDIIKNIF